MDFEKVRARVNEGNLFSISIGCRITELSEGYARAEMDTPLRCTNLVRSVHGGCQYTIADDAAAAAAASCGLAVVTLNVDFHYLRPGMDTKHISATARVRKRGRQVLVVEVDIEDQDGLLLSTATFTCATINRLFEEL